MKAEYIMMDDTRVTFIISRVGRVYSQDGKTIENVGQMEFGFQITRMATIKNPEWQL